VWQFRTLLGRELLAITRNPFDVAARVLTFAWVGVFMGVLNFGVAVRGVAFRPARCRFVVCLWLEGSSVVLDAGASLLSLHLFNPVFSLPLPPLLPLPHSRTPPP
jgi:hypothetical protein